MAGFADARRRGRRASPKLGDASFSCLWFSIITTIAISIAMFLFVFLLLFFFFPYLYIYISKLVHIYIYTHIWLE